MNDFQESSTFNRMQEKYWATKQAVFKKLGKKDDDCIVASDAELDAKLELLQNIEETFFSLMKILESYQDRLCVVAEEENAVGRFLKENAKYDKTKAGKVMVAAGKALSFSAQQKLALRLPLVRLYHEVETFQYRAIVDCLKTIERMEKARTAYRGALMWMKDASQELDPDTCKQLEKFRKVQSNVRKTKTRFEKLKLDTLQKVDLLSFSRCNLFSQALAAYQNGLIAVCEKVSETMLNVAKTTKGYQYYEFSTLKELADTSKRLAERTSEENNQGDSDDSDAKKVGDKDVLLFFASEYRDEDKPKENSPTDQTVNKVTSNGEGKETSDSSLLDLNPANMKDGDKNATGLTLPETRGLFSSAVSSNDQDLHLDKSDMELLNEIMGADQTVSLLDSQPESGASLGMGESSCLPSLLQNKTSCFLPSQLLERQMPNSSSGKDAKSGHISTETSETDGKKSAEGHDRGTKGKQDMSNWYNLFADLDPLANPDLVGKKQVDDLNC